MRVILLTKAQAAAVRNRPNDGHALDPRMIEFGLFVGMYAVPARVLDQPEIAERWPSLADKPQADIDPEVAWP